MPELSDVVVYIAALRRVQKLVEEGYAPRGLASSRQEHGISLLVLHGVTSVTSGGERT